MSDDPGTRVPGRWVLYVRKPSTEYIIGPFDTPYDAADWAEEHREDDWDEELIYPLRTPDEYLDDEVIPDTSTS